jgi:mannose-6-phosphate isomerase-like protein (cupin superfamily)
MVRTLALGSATAALILATSSVSAQNAPPTFQADPEVYKTIFEDQNLRVIAAIWKKGTRDKFHSHPFSSVVYSLNDCRFLIHTADGATRELLTKAGTAMTVPITPSHSAENVGPEDCRAIFVERK